MSDMETTKAFCSDFPEECKGVSMQVLEKYFQMYSEHQKGLSFQFSETAASLKLTGDDIASLTRVVDIVYKSAVRELDRYFGKTIAVLEGAGLLDQSLIIFTADHGELLFREGAPIHWFHGHLEPEILEIPLMIRAPYKRFAGIQYPAVTRSVDVFPTIVKLAELKTPGRKFSGIDLSSSLNGGKFPELIAFAYSESRHPAVMIDDPRNLECIARAENMYFRLSSVFNGSEITILRNTRGDQWEPVNFDPSDARHARVKHDLLQYRTRLISAFPKRVEDSADHEEIREKLRSLGYLN
jgi:arylsulfatase A-like enzyme